MDGKIVVHSEKVYQEIQDQTTRCNSDSQLESLKKDSHLDSNLDLLNKYFDYSDLHHDFNKKKSIQQIKIKELQIHKVNSTDQLLNDIYKFIEDVKES